MKSTITREQLEEWVAQFDEDGGCDATDRQLEALIRQSLAAMDSEPVAYRWNYGGTTIWRLLDTKPGPGSNSRCPRVIEPLYRHAQSSPVVPSAYVRDERGAMMLNGKCEPRIGFGEGWNACRAAMLQAEPVTTANKLGNSPAQSPIDHGYRPGCECSGCKTTVRICAELAGWIPVSERLPEEGGRYWCYVEEQNSLGKSHYQWNCSWNGEIWGGAMMYGRVTHWMPLPAAPQEVK